MEGGEKISYPFGVEQPATAASTDADGMATETHFKMPVDSDHKATEFWIFSFAKPHMRAFHLSWFSFFCCFVSTFAAPPLLPLIRDNLGLTATDIGNAGIASVSGAVFARLAMGTACDLVGPRLASAALTLVTTPVVYFTSVISSANGFLLVRFFTGFSLASFVSTQFWMSSMFSSPKVGIANGFAGGWGNLGGGATQLIMPLVYDLIHKIGSTNFTAWRIAFFIPGFMQTVSAILLLALGQDMPDGNFQKLRVLLRRRAHDRQHHCAVLLRPVQRQSPQRRDNRRQLRPRQHCFAAWRGFALRLALRPVRDAGAVVGAVGNADPRRHLLHPAGQDGDTKRRHRGHDPLLPLRPGRLRPHLRRRPLHLTKVAGADLWDDRRRRQRWGGGNAGDILQGIEIPNRRRHYLHGHHDPLLHPADHPHPFPAVGQHVPAAEVGRHSGGLLPCRVERAREGKELPHLKHPVRRQQRARGRAEPAWRVEPFEAHCPSRRIAVACLIENHDQMILLHKMQ